jgi:hypothetical protein
MTKVSFLIENAKQALELARIIYKSIVDKCSQNWYYALKIAWAYLKGVKKGVLAFRASSTEIIRVRIEKMENDFTSSLSIVVKDINSNVSYSLSIFDLA